jgi:hypothetical protein
MRFSSPRISKRVVIPIVLAVFIIAAAAFGYTTLRRDFEARITVAEAVAADYKSVYGDTLDTTVVYVVAVDVPYGKRIEEADLTPVVVPAQYAFGAISDPAEVVGQYYKINLSAGALITLDAVMQFVEDDDHRSLDVICDYIPIGLEVNGYVDIRVSLPMGEDYVALSHKRVVGIFGTTLKLIMDEFDIATYNSILTDCALYDAQVYATMYTNPGSQAAAAEFYPISPAVLRTALGDPNIEYYINYEDIVSRRLNFESAIAAVTQDETIRQLLRQSRSEIPGVIMQGRGEYETQRQQEAQQKLLEEQRAAELGG